MLTNILAKELKKRLQQRGYVELVCMDIEKPKGVEERKAVVYNFSDRCIYMELSLTNGFIDASVEIKYPLNLTVPTKEVQKRYERKNPIEDIVKSIASEIQSSVKEQLTYRAPQ